MSTASSAVFGSNAAHVVVFKDKRRKILLSQKNNIPMWVLPGGHLEKDESFEKAAIREYQEETGLIIKIIGLKLIYRHKKGFEKRVYEGKIIGGKMKINHETRAIAWFDLNKLPVPMTIYEQHRIKDALHQGNRVIKKPLSMDIKRELIYQLRNPLILIELLYFFMKDFFLGLITNRNSH